MLIARIREETIEGVQGIRFGTNAHPGTETERQLQDIQSNLSGGQVLLPSPTTLPHLSLYSAATADGPSESFIALWVPVEQRLEATALLEAAGFTLKED